VDEDHVVSPAATGQRRKGGRGLVRGPNPAALQITPLTIPTGTGLSLDWNSFSASPDWQFFSA